MTGIEMAVTGKDTRGALRSPSPRGQMEDTLGLNKSSSYSVWMAERKEGGWGVSTGRMRGHLPALARSPYFSKLDLGVCGPPQPLST